MNRPNGNARIIWGIILILIFGLFSLRALIIDFTLGFGLYGVPGAIGLVLGLLVTATGIKLLLDGLAQRRAFLAPSGDQRNPVADAPEAP